MSDSQENLNIDSADVAVESSPATDTAVEEGLYLGNDNLNPNQDPLGFNTEGMSKEEIDEILASNPDMIEPEAKEDTEDDGAPKPEYAEEPSESDTESPEEEESEEETETGDQGDTSTDDEASDPSKDEEVRALLDATGLDIDQFSELPEKTQESLAKTVTEILPVKKQLDDVTTEHSAYKREVDHLLNDPVIAARYEELRTKRAHVARGVPEMSVNDFGDFANDFTGPEQEKIVEIANGYIKRAATQAVQNERAVLDYKMQQKKNEEDVANIAVKLGEIDPRLKIDGVESTRDLLNIKSDDPRWANSELYTMLQYVVKIKKHPYSELKNFTPKELWGMYAAHKGWDKERDTKIREGGAKSILKKLNAAKKSAVVTSKKRRTSKSIPTSGRDGKSSRFDRASVVKDIAKGDMRSYDAYVESIPYDDDGTMMAAANSMYQEGLKRQGDN
jgi:hypothetical protein